MRAVVGTTYPLVKPSGFVRLVCPRTPSRVQLGHWMCMPSQSWSEARMTPAGYFNGGSAESTRKTAAPSRCARGPRRLATTSGWPRGRPAPPFFLRVSPTFEKRSLAFASVSRNGRSLRRIIPMIHQCKIRSGRCAPPQSHLGTGSSDQPSTRGCIDRLLRAGSSAMCGPDSSMLSYTPFLAQISRVPDRGGGLGYRHVPIERSPTVQRISFTPSFATSTPFVRP